MEPASRGSIFRAGQPRGQPPTTTRAVLYYLQTARAARAARPRAPPPRAPPRLNTFDC
jgi:hypothetical protein